MIPENTIKPAYDIYIITPSKVFVLVETDGNLLAMCIRDRQEDISDKHYVQYGTKAERYLRELFKLDYPQYTVEYVKNNSFYNPKYPFARASLDGWLTDGSGRKGVLEIKTTEILSAGQRAKWKDRIPDNYFCQVLFYMAVIRCV